MNSKRGEVNIKALGETFTLRVSTNAMVAYQDQHGETFLDGLTQLADSPGDMKRVRGLFCAAIKGMEEEKAGDIMDNIGLPEAITALSNAAAAAFPNVEPDVGNAQPTKRPPRPKA
jgi:hypothetical protein